MHTDAAAPGETILHYRIQGRLGAGGMGVVYKALDLRLQRPVALKFLPPNLPMEGVYRERLLREAMAASAVEHPNIGAVHAVEETPDQRLFIVMPCYEGGTLKQRMQSGPVSEAEAIDFTLQTARGMAEAHAKGILHRDIKPSNLILTPNGVLKIVDFGLAKILGGADLTETGATMGTAAYMSPEQATGANVDYRTDIWSLGTVLYELVEGRTPFLGETHTALLYAVAHSELPPPTRASGAVRAILRKCLGKAPRERYQSMAALAHDLEQLQKGMAPGGATDPATETITLPKPSPARRRVRLWAGALAAAAALFCAAALWIWRPKPAPPLKTANAPVVAQTPAPAQGKTPLPPPAPAKVAGSAEATPALNPPPARASTEAATKRAPAEHAKLPAPTYAGPREGRIVWTGELETGQELDLTAKSPAIAGTLPGVPVSIELHPSSLEIVTAPSAANQWRRLVVRNPGRKQVAIMVNWALISQ